MPSSKRQTYSTSPIHATRPLMNDPRTIGKQRIHRRVENTGKTGGERHRPAERPPENPETPHHKPTPGRVATAVSECARPKDQYKTTSGQNFQRENNTTTLGTHSAASIRPSSLRLAAPFARHSTYRLSTFATPFAAIAWSASCAPGAAPLGMQHTKMMLHGDQHDVRIFQA